VDAGSSIGRDTDIAISILTRMVCHRLRPISRHRLR
jgi:hypothetical protein